MNQGVKRAEFWTHWNSVHPEKVLQGKWPFERIQIFSKFLRKKLAQAIDPGIINFKWIIKKTPGFKRMDKS